MLLDSVTRGYGDHSPITAPHSSGTINTGLNEIPSPYGDYIAEGIAVLGFRG